MPSYQRRESGLWSVRFTYYEGFKERQKRLSGAKTKREAEEMYMKWIEEHGYKNSKGSQMESFDALLRNFLEYKKSRCKASTYYDINLRIEKHIVPTFGGKKLSQITAPMILAWQNEIAQNYSFNYTSTIRTTLSSIYRYGSRYWNVQNVVEKVEPPKRIQPKKEMQIWTADEFAQFIQCVKKDDFRLFFRFLYASGCRRGEAIALLKDDIDADNGIVHINKSISPKQKSASSPKNESSVRDIDMDGEFLREILSLHTDGKYAFGGDTNLKFSTIQRAWDEAIKKSGVKKIRIHDLRHSMASRFISEGCSIVAVSKRLGHASTQQTLDTYAHFMPSDREQIMKILAKW